MKNVFFIIFLLLQTQCSMTKKLNYSEYKRYNHIIEGNEMYMIIDQDSLLLAKSHIDSIINQKNNSQIKEDCRFLIKALDHDYKLLVEDKNSLSYYSLLLGSPKLIELYYIRVKSRLLSIVDSELAIPSFIENPYGVATSLNDKYESFQFFVSCFFKKKTISKNNFSWFLEKNLCPSLGLVRLIFMDSEILPKVATVKTQQDSFLYYSTSSMWAPIKKEMLVSALMKIENDKLRENDIYFISSFLNLGQNDSIYYKTKW